MSTFEVFSDDKRKLLKFQEAIPGSVVGYEYVQKQRPFLFEDDWFFQDTIPVKQARFILQLPSGREIQHPASTIPDNLRFPVIATCGRLAMFLPSTRNSICPLGRQSAGASASSIFRAIRRCGRGPRAHGTTSACGMTASPNPAASLRLKSKKVAELTARFSIASRRSTLHRLHAAPNPIRRD